MEIVYFVRALSLFVFLPFLLFRCLIGQDAQLPPTKDSKYDYMSLFAFFRFLVFSSLIGQDAQ